MIDKPRRVAVVGGNRIPFARSNSVYSRASNQDMLTAALDGLVARFGLEGERLGEVAGGAVLKHSRDRDLTRESVLGTRLAPETPAYDVQQACGTGLETTILVANKIALGQIDAGIACGADTTSDAPIGAQRGPARSAARRQPREVELGPPQAADAGATRATWCPRSLATRSRAPASRWASTARSWPPSGNVGREEQDELAVRSHHNLAAAYERGFMDDLVSPYLGLERDQNLRPDSSPEKLAKLGPVFGGEEGTMTAANSTPLSDGASAVLLASEEWAKERGLPVLAYFVDGQTAAIDHVHKREGLLMAPAYAMPPMLDRAGLALQDFDLYEIHEAFAAQVLCTLRAWEDGVSAASASAATSRSARSTASGSTSTAARSPPGTPSPRPAGGSSPASPRRSTSAARDAG